MARRRGRRRLRRGALFWLGFGLLVALTCRMRCGESMSVGTFNIRTFPTAATDMDLIVDRMAEMDTTVFAVQEIMDRAAFETVLDRANFRTGRRWRAVLEPYCEPARVWLGVVYDTDRVTLRDIRDHGDLDRAGRRGCRGTHPPALYVEVEREDERYGVLNVHLNAGGSAADFAERRRQWSELEHSVAALRERLGKAPIIVGDFNSTGWGDDRHGEREFIDDTLDDWDLEAVTEDLECTMYWTPTRDSGLVPSTLDHVLTDADVDEVEVLGMCKRLECRPTRSDRDYLRVSDHCPIKVTFDD